MCILETTTMTDELDAILRRLVERMDIPDEAMETFVARLWGLAEGINVKHANSNGKLFAPAIDRGKSDRSNPGLSNT